MVHRGKGLLEKKTCILEENMIFYGSCERTDGPLLRKRKTVIRQIE